MAAILKMAAVLDFFKMAPYLFFSLSQTVIPESFMLGAKMAQSFYQIAGLACKILWKKISR